MSWMSSSKATALLTAVQLNPELLTENAAFVTDTIQRAARWLSNQIGVDRYPDLSQGESVSGASPSTDISLLSTNSILVSIDGDDFNEIVLTLGSLTSGAAIAAELESGIQAISDEGPWRFVTVVYTDVYTITSPTFGGASAVAVDVLAAYEDVAQALKLSPAYGGTEYYGGENLPEFDDMVIRIVNHWYNQVGVEGMQSFSVPGSGSYTSADIEPSVRLFIMANRRIVR